MEPRKRCTATMQYLSEFQKQRLASECDDACNNLLPPAYNGPVRTRNDSVLSNPATVSSNGPAPAQRTLMMNLGVRPPRPPTASIPKNEVKLSAVPESIPTVPYCVDVPNIPKDQNAATAQNNANETKQDANLGRANSRRQSKKKKGNKPNA